MREVKKVPAVEPPTRDRDPWLDKVLDGKRRLLAPEDWDQSNGGRYASKHSAISALQQAGRKRGLKVTVNVRRENMYVQAERLPRASRNGTKEA